jgi:GNAT superfamily N-acetyltransferase
MFVSGLGVDERWRGRGIARVLVERLAETAKRRRCYGMWALTDAANAGAVATYRAAGALSTPRQVMLSWDFMQHQG